MNRRINEWQDLSLKKDIESITRHITTSQTGNTIISIEVILAVLAIILDNLLPSEEESKRKVAFIIILVVAVILFLFYIARKLYNWHDLRMQIKNKRFKIKPYVDLFDNYICYYAMTSISFAELYAKEKDSNSKKFYFIEANYYVNKCICELTKMKNIIKDVFGNDNDDVIMHSKIHVSRLENIICILMETRNICNEAPIHLYIDTECIAKKYDEHMRKFIKKYNSEFNSNIVWKSFN